MIQTRCTVASNIDLDMAEGRPRRKNNRLLAKRLAGAAALGGAAVLALSPPACADLIDVQFGLAGHTSAYSGAGVLGASGNQWNVVTGTFDTTASGIALKDASGSATAVSLSYSASFGPGFANVAGSGGIFDGTPYQNLLTTYMDTVSGVPITVALTGLVPDADYELVLYSAANRVGRHTQFIVNGRVETVDTTSTTTLTDAVNYAEFTTMADASGDLSAVVAEDPFNPDEGDLNGFQLLQVPAAAVPEPTSLALLGAAFVGLGLIRRWRSPAARGA